MTNEPENKAVTTFESKKIRKEWHNDRWYFSVVDVVAVLIEKDYQAARKYWKVLKGRLDKEGAEQVVTNCYQLKMTAEDGKKRLTDTADTETLFRIIQSIPSPKAEPMKQWLARVGYERLQEYEDPSLAVDRARKYYKKLERVDKLFFRELLVLPTVLSFVGFSV